MNVNKITAPVIEIFSSIQGEGLFIGERQIFVRFAECNLECEYCDTDFSETENTKFLNPAEVIGYIKKNLDFDYELHKTLVFTGGEPLLQSDFIKKIALLIHKDLNMNIMLETNGTLPENLIDVIDVVDIVSADFKFNKYSRSNINNEAQLDDSMRFFQILMEHGKDFYIKLVCDENLDVEEFRQAIDNIFDVAPDAIIVIQPIMRAESLVYKKKFDEFFKIALRKFRAKENQVKGDVLFIPQIHKFLGIR